MKKTLYLSIVSLLAIPYAAYLGLQTINPIDPDIVHVKKPNLFAGQWKKVSVADGFTDYLDYSKIEKNLDSTIDITSMRNFFKNQTLETSSESTEYQSIIYRQTIDCFNQTMMINKVYFLSDHFAKGSLVDEPLEDASSPFRVKPGSVGFGMVRRVCELAFEDSDPKYFKSSFMSNI